MKVNDIIEAGYGLTRGTAMARSAMATQTNQNIRANSRAEDSNREANIAQQHSYRSQKRKRVAPTGIPARLLQPQAPSSPAQGEQQ
jgi:hypothetical protein